jgi:hypothetical protein
MSSDEEVVYLGNTRGPSLHYELRAVVEDEEQLDLLYEEGSLLHMMKTQRTRGSTTHLYCAHRANGCKFTAKLMYEDSSLQCQVMTANHHNHEMRQVILNRGGAPGLTSDQRLRIEPLLLAGMHRVTAQSIILHFNAQNVVANYVEVPSRQQLNNYLAYRRKKEGGGTGESPTLSHIIDWCADHSTADENNIDTPFVVDSIFQLDESEQSRFRVALSTSRLLSLMPDRSMIHADATYKIMWQGFPCLLFGWSDRGNHFHPVIIGIFIRGTKVRFRQS